MPPPSSDRCVFRADTWLAAGGYEPVAEAVITPPPAPEPLPELAVTPVEPPTTTKEPTPVPVVKTSTPRVVIKPPEPEAAVSVEQKAQVRLVLKPDTTATVTLTGDGGSFSLSGGSHEVPQGTYRVSVEMPGRDGPQTGTLTVTPEPTTITCDSRFQKCTWLK